MWNIYNIQKKGQFTVPTSLSLCSPLCPLPRNHPFYMLMRSTFLSGKARKNKEADTHLPNENSAIKMEKNNFR